MPITKRDILKNVKRSKSVKWSHEIPQSQAQNRSLILEGLVNKGTRGDREVLELGPMRHGVSCCTKKPNELKLRHCVVDVMEVLAGKTKNDAAVCRETHIPPSHGLNTVAPVVGGQRLDMRDMRA